MPLEVLKINLIQLNKKIRKQKKNKNLRQHCLALEYQQLSIQQQPFDLFIYLLKKFLKFKTMFKQQNTNLFRL